MATGVAETKATAAVGEERTVNGLVEVVATTGIVEIVIGLDVDDVKPPDLVSVLMILPLPSTQIMTSGMMMVVYTVMTLVI